MIQNERTEPADDNTMHTKHWLVLTVAAVTTAVLFLLANVIPRAELNFPTIDGEPIAPYSTGKLTYGFPKTTQIIEITQAESSGAYYSPTYSIRHFVGLEKYDWFAIQRSAPACVANALLAVSISLLVGIGIHGLVFKQYSVRMLIAATALVAVAIASARWNCPI